MHTPPLTILCAMHAEAEPIAAVLGLIPTETPWDPRLPPRLWAHPERAIRLATNGTDERTGVDLIGTNPATLATRLLAEHLHPRAVLVAGAAGGRSDATEIGRVHLIDRAFYHDRRIPLPGFDRYGIGPEPLHHSPELAAAFGVTSATISTGNAIDTLPAELGFFREHNVIVKDMETAAIAWTANLHGIPAIALRAITDLFDHPAPESQFLANFDAATRALASSVARGIDTLLAETAPTA